MIDNSNIAFIDAAILNIRPNSSWASTAEGTITEWLDTEQTEPTQAEIDAEVTRLQAEYDSQEYARNRKAEYDVLNQFELMTDDAANGTTTHVDAIAVIKKKYPKGLNK